MPESKSNRNDSVSDLRGMSDVTASKQKEPLKVVHVCMQEFGGAGKAAYRLHKGLQSIGVNSTMVVFNKKTGDPSVKVLPESFLTDNLSCLDVSSYESDLWKKTWARWSEASRSYPGRPDGLEVFTDAESQVRLDLIKEVKAADVINLHWAAGMLDCPNLPQIFRNKHIVWTLHDMNPFTGGCHYTGDCLKYTQSCGACPQLGSDNPQDLSRHVWNQKLNAYKDIKINVVTPSRWLGKCAHESALFSQFPINVIPYGFPLDVFKPYPKAEVLKAFNVSPSARVILFGADSVVNQRKGFRYLLNAIEKLSMKDDQNNVIFTFGNLPKGVKISSKYPIYSLGSIGDEKKLAMIYSSADVFVIPSLEDNLPNTVVEAMACGVPVVGFDIGGIPDMIEHKKTGYLVPPKDTTALAEGIEWVLSSNDRGENLSAQCRQKAVNRYALEIQASAYKNLYDKLLNDKKASVFERDVPLSQYSIPAAVPHELQIQHKKSQYLVSAIVSTYNAESFIRGCLEDLVNQTLYKKGELEIIVVNSGSQQNEEAIVREYQQKYNNIVYIKTEQREGIYAAWNRAVKVAQGTFITNANTDDRHREDALEIMAETLLANPDATLVYGDQICTDTPNGTFANHHAIEMAKRAEYSHERLLFGCCVGSQPMWRKSLHNELGYFDDTLTCAGDWDFWLRISISSRYKFKHIPEFLGLYYYNENGIEHGRKIHSLYERYIVGKRYGNPYISVIPLYTSKNNPLVSVIMPAYNAAKHIAETIESVLIQNYRNFELIIVDDGSTDNTKDIVASFKDDKIKYFYKDNGGPSGARNLAINKAKGQYIMPLDADDMMTADFIAAHLAEFEKHPDVDLIYCDDCLIDENSKPIRVIERPEYTDRRLLIRDLFHCGFPVVPFRTCIRRSVFDKIGFFDEELLVGEDYDMMRRFVKHGLKIHHLKGAMYLRRMTSDSLSRNYSAQKAKSHFDVIKRFTDTFTYDELFPDIEWDKIVPEMRQLHAKCLTAGTYLAIGQEYAKTNATEYSRTAFDQACSELNDCLKMDPENQGLRQLLQKSNLIRARYTEAPQQLVSK